MDFVRLTTGVTTDPYPLGVRDTGVRRTHFVGTPECRMESNKTSRLEVL